ncbi:genetic suppressor element 1-like isoform X2 [Littorina saxatilis]|uniref:genetic suppressor element 1-like isoform X2 n=1 Tax=Littorina saxatilis TaxID=31220 RepID=UPI0038B60B4A
MPGSRGVCFVCGSLGAELRLHSKPREQGPYFPFLEHHETPKGCRPPAPDGVVDSCRVCYAFLTQQWETYERSKTPALKRLYWLKRNDELSFTGAEMKLQGEYMAQVMGLQYQPNCHDNCSTAPLSPDDRRPSGYAGGASSARDNAGGYSGANDVPPVGGTTSGRPGSRHTTHGGVPEVQHISRVRAAEPEGALDLSVSNKTPENHAENARPPSNRLNTTNFRDLIVCFTCNNEMYVMNSKVVSSVRVSTSEPYFPFLEKISPLKGAVPLSREHLTRVCEGCFASAYQQWIAYERACTPTSARMYKIKDKYYSDGSPHPAETEKKIQRVRADEVCYLCGQMKSQNQIVPLYTAPPPNRKQTMYFPFIRELRRPHGAQPLNPDGTVLVCTSCNGNLKTQWEHYERETVPLLHRRYSLLPINAPAPQLNRSEFKNGLARTESPRVHPRQKSTDSRREVVDITQPLNIQISKSPVHSSSTAHGLLAIAPQTPRSVTGDISTNSNPSGLVMSETAASGLNPKSSDLPRGTGSISCGSTAASSVPHPLQQAATLPKKVCFLCGENCLLSKSHLLFSYPVRHEAKSTASTQSVPFFPLLANKEPAPGSDSMTDEGTVISCNYCYFSLISQWKDYEDSKSPADTNRWLRKYSVREFVCYICGQGVPRRKIRTLEVQKFHFLKEHKAPGGALVLDAGEAVATCDACTFSLTHQYAEYERMGVPQDLRKYNWTSVPASEENSQDHFDQGAEERWRRGHYPNDDGSVSVAEHAAEGDDSNTGLGQGSKPPALSMLSPASGKMTPKTATVPPLSQGSPSNGLSAVGSNTALNATRTSSFAAALRKLAHQAKDPQEEAAVLAAAAKHSGSPNNSGSPRSTTPKRAPQPPPLVYTSQSTILNSPPVVTIAPTQSMAHPTDGRQSSDRVPSTHSTGSSYDHYNVKHERDQRPHSSHSRDEDRTPAKDSAHTPTRIAPQTSAGMSREESLSRGFHPYRPEDDLHRAAAAAAALQPYGIEAAYAAAYHPAFFQHPSFQSAAMRYEDPLMERLRLMQAAPFLPFPPGLVPHPGMHPLLSAGARYPPELLHQYAYLSPGSAQALDARTSQVSAERSKSEEDRSREAEREKEKEKEKREKDRERERDREREAELVKRERLRELEREKQRSAEHSDRRDILTVPSRYLSDREGERESHRSDHHHQHPTHHQSHSSSHKSKAGSISQGTPRGAEYTRPTSRTSEGSHEKSHYSSSSPRHNHYHQKYENHSLPRSDRPPSESSRHSYHHPPAPHGDQDQSKGQPPPLISPHRSSSSKGSTDTALFRPFERDEPTNSAAAVSHDNKSPGTVSASQSSSSGKYNHRSNSSAAAKDVSSSSSLPATVRVFGSTPEAKILNSNFINHRVEKFDFKSLARECSSREGGVPPPTVTDSAASSQPAAVVVVGEENGPVPALPPSLPPVVVVPTIAVSRLDARENLLQKAREEGEYKSESEEECELEEEEERRRDRLTVVDDRLPADLVLTSSKLAVLGALQLTTLQNKKDLTSEFLCKRRKLMGEPSVSPVELDEDDERSDLTPPNFRLSPLSDSKRALPPEKNFLEKCQFLSVIRLRPVPPEQKKAVDTVRHACEDDRRRRKEKKRAKVRRRLELQQQELLAGLNRSSAQNNNNNKRKYDEMASESSNPLDITIEPLRITLGQLQERHMAAARQEQEKQHVNHTHSKTGDRAADGGRPVIFPDTRDRHLSREFAEQFHESVLQSTRQKESQKLGHTNHNTQDILPKHPVSANHLRSSSAASVAGDHDAPAAAFPWPGIVGVLESYSRHRTEQQAEARMLVDRCRQLHSENMEMNRAAEALSKRLKALEDDARVRSLEREHLELAIGSLKKTFNFHR